MKSTRLFPWALCLFTASTVSSLRAGTFNANFNDGQVPPNANVFGNTVIEASGGVGNSGVLKLTKALGSQSGSLIINDLDNGATVYGFRASMKVRIGGGSATPADGWSFNVAPDLPDGSFGEEGAGGGLSICFDTYVNADVGETSPTIDFKVGGALVASWPTPINNLVTGTNFVPLNIFMHPNGSLDLDYNGKVIFTNLFFANYTGIAASRFGLGARTGGAYANHFIDDLSIETYLQPAVGITRQPVDLTVLAGRQAVFSVAVNNGDGVAFQWLRNGQPITGATSDTYSLTAANTADEGARFSVKISSSGTSLTSQEAVLHVTTLTLPATPVLAFNFDDGAVPANTAVYGDAFVDSAGGVADSGALKLTLDQGNLAGAFILEDPQNAAPVYGFAASFHVRLGGGSALPADGFSFNFATNLLDASSTGAESGVGTGISVCFDTYDNGNGEAPAAELRINGLIVAAQKVPAGFLVTGDNYVDVQMVLGPDGMFSLAWNGIVLLDRIKAEGFSSLGGGRFGFYARTGGSYSTHWIDDLKIYTYTTAELVRITSQPKTQIVLVGKNAVFTVEVNDPSKASYQWFKNGQPISGATQNALTLANITLNDDQAKIKVEVTGLNNKAVSDEAILSVLDLAPPANPQLSLDFNNGVVPSNTRVVGNAFVDAAGGANDSGVLKLTIAENSQSGVFLVEPLEGGAEVSGFTAAFAVRVGGGTSVPADGFSFNYANDLPNATFGDAENGAGTGITVAFDIYDNSPTPADAISVDLKYKGQVVVSKVVPISLLETGDAFVDVLVRVRPEGLFDLVYNNVVIYGAQPILGYTNIANGRLGLAARTGGLNENFWMDNIRLAVIKATGPTHITGQPTDTLVLVGQSAAFSVLVNDPQGVTYQWYKNGAAITGATQAGYSMGPCSLADHGSLFTVTVTGSGTVTSLPATLGVMAPFSAPSNSDIAFDFNDGAVPTGSLTLGSAFVDVTGGVNDSGVLKLTINENSQSGSFICETPAGVESIQDFMASWKIRVGGGTAVAADGFSFVMGADIPDTAFREEGAGTGLVLSFDTYDNSNGEAPAIDILYDGMMVASHKLPISVLRTGDSFAAVDLRVNRNGTLDLIYGSNAIYHNAALPGFRPFTGSRFGFGGATGGLNDNHWVDDLRVAFNIAPNLITMTMARKTDGTLTLTWTGGGTLQETATIKSEWTNLSPAASPYTVTPTNSMRFYRVKQ